MTIGKPVAPDLAARIRKAAKENPEMSLADLSRRFSLGAQAIKRALQNEFLPEGQRFPVGTSVRVRCGDRGSRDDRTGVVVNDALPFPWRDHRDIELDAVPGKARFIRVPAAELKLIKPSERSESARPREQLEVFEASE